MTDIEKPFEQLQFSNVNVLGFPIDKHYPNERIAQITIEFGNSFDQYRLLYIYDRELKVVNMGIL